MEAESLFYFMAIFRKVHVTFWRDEFVEGLTPEQKFFYLYLLTNDRTTQCGIYEITTKQMCYDTGYNEDTIKKLISFFIDIGKIKYSVSTKEMALKNWGKYNDSNSPKVRSCIEKELLKVKDRVLIQYIYSIDTHTQEEQEEEKEEEKEQQQEKEKEIEKVKIKLREHVFISQTELDKLNSEYLEHEVNWMLDKLNDYKASKGVQYKSDYHAINMWVKDAFRKAKVDFIKDNNTFSTRMQIVQNTINNTDWNKL